MKAACAIVAVATGLGLVAAHSSYCPNDPQPTPDSNPGCLTYEIDGYTLCVLDYSTCQPVTGCGNIQFDNDHSLCFDSCATVAYDGERPVCASPDAGCVTEYDYSGKPFCVTDECGVQVSSCDIGDGKKKVGVCPSGSLGVAYCFVDCTAPGSDVLYRTDYFGVPTPYCSTGPYTGKSPCEEAFDCGSPDTPTLSPSTAPTAAPSVAPTAAPFARRQ
eukprot:TRINITY_DN4845_c0_g1_i1.p2 TRINITY_DN4845_c0_g1~~TRINITY_DN4845_c0_g1_i1.p2  ORF type:complete len:217 (+),score=40.85 TRINITY_DN4845_c0_g1_i1:106-756(+)